jgi:hypothetical protein
LQKASQKEGKLKPVFSSGEDNILCECLLFENVIHASKFQLQKSAIQIVIRFNFDWKSAPHYLPTFFAIFEYAQTLHSDIC